MLFGFDGNKIAIDSIYSFKTDTDTKVYNLEVAGNNDYYVSASGVLVHNCENGGLNLFKFGKSTTTKSTGWKTGDRMLNLPNKGSVKLNWKQNSSFLRREMNSGKPIFDSYRNTNGSLIPTRGFLNAERNLLKNHGWNYNPKKGYWFLP